MQPAVFALSLWLPKGQLDSRHHFLFSKDGSFHSFPCEIPWLLVHPLLALRPLCSIVSATWKSIQTSSRNVYLSYLSRTSPNTSVWFEFIRLCWPKPARTGVAFPKTIGALEGSGQLVGRTCPLTSFWESLPSPVPFPNSSSLEPFRPPSPLPEWPIWFVGFYSLALLGQPCMSG